MEIIERSIAQKVGLKTYYTGKLCRKGHLAYRYTTSGACSECINGTSRFTDLRQAGLPPIVAVAERNDRVAAHTEDVEHARHLRAQQEQAREVALVAQAEQAKLKADREASLPHVATDRYLICYDADWMTVRAVLVMETQAIYPALTPEDIAPLNGVKNFGGLVYRHTVHTTAELWQTLSDMSNAMLRARQGPIVAPKHGRLEYDDLLEWLGWVPDTRDLNEVIVFYPYGDVEERERTKDRDAGVKLGEFWYRPYEILALIKKQRVSIEPIQDE